ncbi:MAG: hypothetical protein V4515_07520 [Chloroflexota bacterium]
MISAGDEGPNRERGRTGVTLRQQIKRANPTTGSPTYRPLKGEISQAQYKKILNDVRGDIAP